MDVPGAQVRRTLAGAGTALVEARRSKFHAYARPLPDDPDHETLRRWVAEVRALHRGARHVVHAWRGTAGRSQASDDGEPHGTGARPCLDALAQAGVEGAAVAVARIFGGVLLGTGNLARAYAEAAAAAIATAGIRELRPHRHFAVHVPYAGLSAVEAALRDAGAVDLARTPAAEGLHLAGHVPAEQVSPLTAALAAATAGRARPRWADDTSWR